MLGSLRCPDFRRRPVPVGGEAVYLPPVAIGGLTVGYLTAVRALHCLAAHPGLMIRQPLLAIGNPVAQCDYHAEAAAFRSRYLSEPVSGRGAAGRHLTKSAFLDALEAAIDDARCRAATLWLNADVAAAQEALARDFSLSAVIAAQAVSIWRKRHQQQLRSRVRQAVRQAVSMCEARRGQFECDWQGACGTGGCRFARGMLTRVLAPAGEGRVPRPANHVACGTGYSLTAAEQALEALQPFQVGVHVSDDDRARVKETAAA